MIIETVQDLINALAVQDPTRRLTIEFKTYDQLTGEPVDNEMYVDEVTRSTDHVKITLEIKS